MLSPSPATRVFLALAPVAGDLHEPAPRPPADVQDVLAEETQTSEAEKAKLPRRQRKRRQVPVHLEVQTTVLEPTDPACEHCGQLGDKIGEEVSEQVDLIPARLIVRRTVRIKRGCQCGCGPIAIAPLPPRLLPGSILGLGLAVFILLSKYDDLWFFGVPGGDVMLLFDRGRSHTVPLEALKGFNGAFQSDDFSAYETLVRKRTGLRRLGCAAGNIGMERQLRPTGGRILLQHGNGNPSLNNRYVHSSLGQNRAQPKPRPTRARTQVEHVPCARALKRARQNWNHGRVWLRLGDHELQVICLGVTNHTRTPILVVDFKEVKAFHGCNRGGGGKSIMASPPTGLGESRRQLQSAPRR